MRALNAKVELCNAARVFARARNGGNVPEFENVWLGAIRRSEGNYENSGNEAKEYLKTKDITILSGANDARFAPKSAQFGR